MKFSQIQCAQELRTFLEDNAKKHKFLYHFTTAKSLECMYKYRTWRFSSAAKMNDLHEFKGKTSSTTLWNTIYSTCFSFGDEDNIAMWAMYGIPWEDAVRIRINKKDMNQWINYIQGESTEYNDVNVQDDEGKIQDKITDVSLHDICYYQGYLGRRQVLTDCPYTQNNKEKYCSHECKVCPPKVILWNRQQNKNTMIVDNDCQGPMDDKLVGFIKNSAWAHEHETRLVLKMVNFTGQDYIDLPVPRTLLQNMQISIGPRSSLTVEQVQKMMTKYLPIAEVGDWTPNISESYFHQTDYLKQLRRHCCLDTQKKVVFKNSLEDFDKEEEK